MVDVMTVWSDNGKQKLRKHFMTMCLREAHSIFCKMFDDGKGKNVISYAKFCDLRPPNALLLGDTPRDQCKCLIHENFFLKLNALGYSYER